MHTSIHVGFRFALPIGVNLSIYFKFLAILKIQHPTFIVGAGPCARPLLSTCYTVAGHGDPDLQCVADLSTKLTPAEC